MLKKHVVCALTHKFVLKVTPCEAHALAIGQPAAVPRPRVLHIDLELGSFCGPSGGLGGGPCGGCCQRGGLQRRGSGGPSGHRQEGLVVDHFFLARLCAAVELGLLFASSGLFPLVCVLALSEGYHR